MILATRRANKQPFSTAHTDDPKDMGKFEHPWLHDCTIAATHAWGNLEWDEVTRERMVAHAATASTYPPNRSTLPHSQHRIDQLMLEAFFEVPRALAKLTHSLIGTQSNRNTYG